MAVVVFPQDGAPRVAKRLLWELDAPGPLPLLPPGPGKDLQAWGPWLFAVGVAPHPRGGSPWLHLARWEHSVWGESSGRWGAGGGTSPGSQS